jgi:hypothetical protein
MVVKYDDLHRRFNELQQKFILLRDDNNKAKADFTSKTELYRKQESELKNQVSDLSSKLASRETELV